MTVIWRNDSVGHSAKVSQMTISIQLYLYLLLTTIFFSFHESNKKATYLSQWSEQDEAHIFTCTGRALA